MRWLAVLCFLMPLLGFAQMPATYFTGQVTYRLQLSAADTATWQDAFPDRVVLTVTDTVCSLLYCGGPLDGLFVLLDSNGMARTVNPTLNRYLLTPPGPLQSVLLQQPKEIRNEQLAGYPTTDLQAEVVFEGVTHSWKLSIAPRLTLAPCWQRHGSAPIWMRAGNLALKVLYNVKGQDGSPSLQLHWQVDEVLTNIPSGALLSVPTGCELVKPAKFYVTEPY